MIKLISSILNLASSVILSLVIANYGIEKLYSTLQKEVIQKIKIGLPPLSGMTNQLTCKNFNEKMELVPYTKGHCAKKGARDGKK